MRPYTVSDLLRLVYEIELGLIFSGHAEVSREAFIRNYWSVVLKRGGGSRSGLYAKEMMDYLASMHAWWQLTNRDPEDLQLLIHQSQQDHAFAILLYNKELQKGATNGQPASWANWTAGSDAYTQLMNARHDDGKLGGEPIPLLYRFCSAHGDYAFAVVTSTQNQLLEVPSTVNGATDPECGDNNFVKALIYNGKVLH